MAFSALLLPIVGFLFAFDQSRTIKIMLFGIIGSAFVHDLITGRFSRPTTARLRTFFPVILFQALMSLSWTSLFFGKTDLIVVSRMMISMLILFPWVAILLTFFLEPRHTRIYGYTASGLGAIALVIGSMFLGKLGIGVGETEASYGANIVGTTSNALRTILAGFPGIVSGGVFCSLGAACAVASMVTSRSLLNFLTSLAAYLIAGYGIYLTDSRSAFASYFALLILGLTWLIFIFTKRIFLGEPKFRGLLLGRSLIICAAGLPFALPLLGPMLDAGTSNLHIPLISDKLLRENESLFSFTGRTYIWDLATGWIASRGITVVSLHPVGEYATGVSIVLYSTGLIPGLPEYAHSHNAVLNFYFSYGLAGILLLIFVIISISRTLLRLRNWQNICLILPFIAFTFSMSFESLLAPAYRYFGLYLTLFLLDLVRQRWSLGNAMKVPETKPRIAIHS